MAAECAMERADRLLLIEKLKANIPQELQERRQFCARARKRPFVKKAGVEELTASWTPGPKTEWLTFDQAIEVVEQGMMLVDEAEQDCQVSGIGFLTARTDPQMVGGDLDRCRDPETGLITPSAVQLLSGLRPFYTEISPSGCGLRFFCYGDLPNAVNSVEGVGPNDVPHDTWERILEIKPDSEQPNELELYTNDRHLSLTGDKLEELCYDEPPRTFDFTVVEPWINNKIEPSKNGPEAKSQSDPVEQTTACKPSHQVEIGKSIDGWRRYTPDQKAHYCRQALQSAVEVVRCASVGRRNTTLNDQAFAMGTLVASGYLDESEVRSALVQAATANGLSQRESEATLDSGFSAGLSKPRDLSGIGVPQEGRIRQVSSESWLGSIGVANDGTVREVQDSKNDDNPKRLKWISDCALYIDRETLSADGTREYVFRGTGAKDKKEVTFTCPASEMAEPRKFKAAVLNAFSAVNMIGDLTFEMVQRMSLNFQHMRRIEVPCWDGNVPLMPGVDLAGDVEFNLSFVTPSAVYDGDAETARECLRKLLGLHKYAPLLVCAILGAPAVARWHPNERFGLGLWGLTGSLKTSVAQAAMTVYGVGYMDDEGLLKHNRAGSTQVGAMEVFANAGFLPQILDNVKTVDPKDSLRYVEIIHAVIEGRERLRGKKDGGLRDARSFCCTPIITGEIRPEEASTTARVLNLNWTRPENLEGLTFVQQNVDAMPVIGYHWLRFLAGTDWDLVDGFDEARNRKMGEFAQKHITNPGRLATIYTLMRGIWNLLCESPWGDVFGEFTDAFVAALDEAIEVQGDTVSEETEVAKFLAGLAEMLARSPHMVETGRREYGDSIGKWTENGLFLLPGETLTELQRSGVFVQKPSPDSMTKALASAGLLVKDGKHLKAKVLMRGTRVRGWLLSAEAVASLGISRPAPPEFDCPTGRDGSGAQKPDTSGSVPHCPTRPTENVKDYLRKSGQRFLDECPGGEGENEKSFYGGAGGASGAEEQNKQIITSTDIDINTNNKCPTKCPTKLTSGAQLDNVPLKSPSPPLGGLKPLAPVDLLSYESDSRIIGSPHYRQCQEYGVPYVAIVLLDDDLADLIVDCNTMRPDAERMDFSEYYQVTLPRSQVWHSSQRACEIIACNPELDGPALIKLIQEEFAPLEHQHEVERIHQRFNTPGQPLLSDDPETAWLRSHLTPLLEDMILLSIELQTECDATSVSLSRMVSEGIGLTEELVVRYLLATGWRRDADDPDCFWAPRWQRHKRTEQDYQQADSWVLAMALEDSGHFLGDQRQLVTPSAEICS